MIEIAVTRKQGEFTVDVDLKLEGPVSALFGPSGAGSEDSGSRDAGCANEDSASADALVDSHVHTMAWGPSASNAGRLFGVSERTTTALHKRIRTTESAEEAPWLRPWRSSAQRLLMP